MKALKKGAKSLKKGDSKVSRRQTDGQGSRAGQSVKTSYFYISVVI